jgi:hypothetical protein
MDNKSLIIHKETGHKRQFHALEGIMTKSGTIFLEYIE